MKVRQGYSDAVAIHCFPYGQKASDSVGRAPTCGIIVVAMGCR